MVEIKFEPVDETADQVEPLEDGVKKEINEDQDEFHVANLFSDEELQTISLRDLDKKLKDFGFTNKEKISIKQRRRLLKGGQSTKLQG